MSIVFAAFAGDWSVRRESIIGVLLSEVLKKSLHGWELFPQRLKPHYNQSICGTAEAVPLSKTSRLCECAKRINHWCPAF
jgi:hypothetical protein